jgi:hypothetical protein
MSAHELLGWAMDATWDKEQLACGGILVVVIPTLSYLWCRL